MNQFRQAEKELIWYFNHSDAAIGFKSSHASFVSAVYGVTSTTINTDPYTDGLLRQVRKCRQIRNTFHSLPSQTRRVLEACYNQEVQYRYPPEVVRIYGYKTGAALFNTRVTDLESLIRICRKKIQSKLSESEEVAMFKLGEEVRAIFDKAHQEYLDSRTEYMNKVSVK